MSKAKTIYLCVNGDGFVCMFSGEPVRDEENQKWIGKWPYINSIVYKNILPIAFSMGLTWENEPEIFELTKGKNK